MEEKPMEVDNLCTQPDLTEEGLVAILRARYEKDLVYTNSGLQLLALNPYAALETNGPVVEEMHRRRVENLHPHIFALVEECRDALAAFGAQSIVLSGESGAGKTETARRILGYLGVPLASAVETVLEALGNARTAQNDNSSRFGKLVRLDGAVTVEVFLLEKSRVTASLPGRNFHVFYYLLAARNETLRNDYIDNGAYVDGKEREEDEAAYRNFCEALTELGIGVEAVEAVLRGILLLGAVTIADGAVTDQAACEKAAACLCLAPERLEDYLLRRTIRAGREEIVKEHSDTEARVLRDSTARLLYSALFEHVTARINAVLGRQPVAISGLNILDLFGFEDAPPNGLDQLCINWANERVYDEFVRGTFEHERRVLLAEDVQAPGDDEALRHATMRASAIPLFEKPCGLADLISEESFLNGTAESLSAKIEKSLHLKVSSHRIVELEHFAGPVRYDLSEILNRNTEKGSLQKLYGAQVESGPAHELIEVVAARPHVRSDVVRGFRASLDILFTVLRSTNIHYVKCIKPNALKQPRVFDDALVLRQMRANGILSAVELSRHLYPCSMFIDDFGERYGHCDPADYELVRGRTRVFFNNRTLNILEMTKRNQAARRDAAIRDACRRCVTAIRKACEEVQLAQVRQKEKELVELENARALADAQAKEAAKEKNSLLNVTDEAKDHQLLESDSELARKVVDNLYIQESSESEEDPARMHSKGTGVPEASHLIESNALQDTRHVEASTGIQIATDDDTSKPMGHFPATVHATGNNGINNHTASSDQINNHAACEMKIKELESELSKYKKFSVACADCQVLRQKYKIQSQELQAKQAVEIELAKTKARLRAYEDSDDSTVENTSVYNIFSCLIQLYLDYAPVYSTRDIPKDEMLSLAHAILFVLDAFPRSMAADNLGVCLDEVSKRLADFEENISAVAFVLANILELRIAISTRSSEDEAHFGTLDPTMLDPLIAILFSHICALQRRTLGDLLPGSILDHQQLKEYKVRESVYKKIFAGPTIARLVDHLEYFYNMNAYFCLPDIAIINNLSFLLSHIDFVCFNALLAKRKFLCYNRCMQIDYNLSELEKFCFNISFHDGFFNVAYMREAMKIAIAMAASPAQGSQVGGEKGAAIPLRRSFHSEQQSSAPTPLAELVGNSLLSTTQINTIIALFDTPPVEPLAGSPCLKKFINEPTPILPALDSLRSPLKFVMPKFLPGKSIKSLLRTLKDPSLLDAN